MKLRFLVSLVLLFFSLQDSLFSQMPIEYKNRWDYIEGWWDGSGGNEKDTISYIAITDTLLPNGKYYHRVSPESIFFRKYIRVDTSGVWYYDTGCNDEFLYYSYSSAVGEERIIPSPGNCDTLLFWATVTKLKDTLATFFGRAVRYMLFSYVEGVDGWFTVGLSPEFGFIDFNTGGTGGNYYKYLMGCELSGMIYGNLLSAGDDIKYPGDFVLLQNYPNPFNPSTVIRFSLSSGQFITLKISDILGNEIDVPVHEEKPAGDYRITWNAENFPAGIYFYTLFARNKSVTRKMILIK